MFIVLLSIILIALSSEVTVGPYQVACNSGVQVGTNCGSTNLVQMQAFCVYPWPPSPGVRAEILVWTLWSQESYLSEIAMGTCFNNMFWTYTPYDFGNYMSPGVSTEFGWHYSYPTQAGSYIANFQFVVNGQHANCWQFTFNI